MEKELLNIKNQKKSKNPKFIRSSYHKKMRVSEKKWRKPRGKDNKIGQRMQGRAIVHPGYGTPADLRGTNRKGKFVVLVSVIEELKTLDPKVHSIIISKRIGFKKRKALLEEIKKSKFDVENIKKPDEYVKAKETKLQEKKNKTESKTKKKETVVKQKESIEDKLSEEEKKKIEKQEIDRLLTKKF